jgi:hypothetical protein
MNGAHMMLPFVCVAMVAAGFVWQIRKEKEKSFF